MHRASSHAAFAVGLVLFVASIPALATPAAASDPPALSAFSGAGHYCVSCHAPDDARLTNALAWNGAIGRASLSPCPTVQQLRWELAYTDDAFDAIGRAESDLGARDAATSNLARLTLARAESYPRLVETSYRSVDAGLNEIRSARFQLNKSYMATQSERSTRTNNVMLIVGLAVTLFLAISLAWGYRNTRGAQGPARHWLRPEPLGASFVFLVFGIFALPLFNPPVQSDTSTAAALARQTALDAGTKAATSAENESAKAWQLARLAGTWARVNGSSASTAWTEAVSATKELETNADAYWGRVRTLEEAAVGWEQAPEAAGPVVQRIQVAASTAWAHAAMAGEFAAVDRARATELLAAALARAQKNADPDTRAFDLKVISVAWSMIDKAKGETIAGQIDDPFIRAWAWRELGRFDQAAASARQVDDANRRTFALREIAVAAANASLLNEAQTVAQALPDPARAYALSDLAVAWAPIDAGQAGKTAGSIAVKYPDARAVAYRGIGLYDQAWREIARLDAGFEQGRAQAGVIAAWARVSPDQALAAAKTMQEPYWSAQAQRAIAAEYGKSDVRRALDLAQAIPVVSARVQALADIARESRDPSAFQQAAAGAQQLRDPYPLRDLVIAWAPVDASGALALVDQLDRESDRAQALLAIALALAPVDRDQANAVFDRALKQAQGARLRGDSYYATELLRTLGERYASVDAARAAAAFNAALDVARKVSTAF